MMYDKMYICGVLVHHGIHGQRWGKRNGPPYPLKSSAHSKAEKVFISGSSKTQFKDSPYYRKKLSRKLRADIKREMRNKSTILVGDAPGIDRQVQDYLKKKRYKNVEVYSPGKEARYLADKNWKNTTVDVPDAKPGSPEWLAAKDKVMQDKATKGIAVILPNGSGATRKNIDKMISDNKDVKIYQLTDDKSDNVLKSMKRQGLVPKNATAQNMDSWGKSEKTNVLYISGKSGSGKSTVANNLKDKDTEVIHLDSYFDRQGSKNKDFNKYLKDNNINPNKMSSKTRTGKDFENFENAIELYSKSKYKEGKKVIVEGVQLLDDTVRPDKKYFNDKPIMLVNTNSLTSIVRGNKRDSKKTNLNDIQNSLKWNKYIKEVKKNNNLKHSIERRTYHERLHVNYC